MIINHNMMSMNAQRAQGVNAGGLGKSIEKLSTGQRVNRAADDAAGLYISEKMRTQVRGLTQASRNAQDGISAVQTAEGALDEVHSMLQRMRELTVQAGNETNQKEDREAIQSEIDQLTKEIDSISAKTEFNKQKLLDGNFTGKKLQVGANTDQSLTLNIDSMSGKSLGLIATEDRAGVEAGEFKANSGSITAVEAAGTIDANGTNHLTIEVVVGAKTETLKVTAAATKEEMAKKIKETIEKAGGKATVTGDKVDFEGPRVGDRAETISVEVKKSGSATGNVNKVNGANGQDRVDAVKALKEGDIAIDVVTNYKATAGVDGSLDTIDKAIAKVSKQRSDLGAIQNRLEHTIKNLDNAAENTQAAESRIRDTNMAKEMSEFTKNNVLSQAAQSMISQANQLPQQALQLLR